jgi:DNA polymerase
VDAKERLRLYLEQRRDAGESELVLDSMAVDDVLRLLGAASAARPGREEPVSSPAGRAPSPAERAVPLAPSADTPRDPSSEEPRGAPPADWREALRALDPRTSDERPGSAASGERVAAPRAVAPRSDNERAPTPVAPTRSAERPNQTGEVAGADASSQADVAAAAPRQAAGGGEGGTEGSAPQSLEHVPTGLVVGSPAHELFGGPQSPFATLEDIARATQGCQLCALHRTARQAVPGVGNPQADFVCVGEAPGANEDEQGVPFVGPAGQLLTKILGAIQLTREEVFICNVLKHRPPGNRNPLPEEVAACSPYLVRQIELLAPKVIVALGTFAAQTLLQTKEPIGKLRGKIHRYYGVPLIVTYHPAALLRNPSWKRPTWEDVQLARRLLDRARGT